MKIVVILPTYNERENIKKVIYELKGVFQSLSKKYEISVLVVDDRSPDGTGEIVASLAKKDPKIYLLNGEKRGLGAAYVRGINYAIEKMSADVVFEMDADLSHDPKLIPQFLKEIDDGSDFVIGSRYILGGSIPQNWGVSRKIYSTVANLFVRFGLMTPSIHDWTSGYRAIRTRVFKTIGTGLSRFPGYTFQVVVLHRTHQAHFVISEIPLQFVDRSWGKSKIIPPEYIASVVAYVLLHSTFIRYLSVGVGGFVLQTLVSHILVSLDVFPGVAVAFGAEASIIFNFFTNNTWTFSHKKVSGKRNMAKKFLTFQISSFGAVVIQSAVVSLATLELGEQVWFIAMVLSIIFLVIPYNFFIYNRFIWKTHER